MRTVLGKTRTVTVNSVADTIIQAATYCDIIEIGEDRAVASWPLTDYQIRKPAAADTPRQIGIGLSYRFVGRFSPNDIVGYVRAVSVVSTTFFIDEQGREGVSG
jgi:hypothetical protein